MSQPPLRPDSLGLDNGNFNGNSGVAVNGGSSTALSKTSPRPGADDSGFYGSEFYDEGWSLKRIKKLLRRRRAIVLSVFVAVLGLSMLLGILTPRAYRSTAKVLINTDKGSGSGLGTDMPALSGLLDGVGGRSQGTEIEILQSQPVLYAARQRLPNPLRGVAIGGVEVRPVGQTDLVEVSTTSPDPIFSQRFTNSLCDAYVARAQEKSTSQYSNSAKYVAKQLKILKVQLDEKGDELRRYKQEEGITDLNREASSLVDRLSVLQATLQQARVEKAANESQLTRLIASAAKIPAVSIVPGSITVRPQVTQYNAELVTLLNRRSALTQEYTVQSPEVRQVDGEISRIRAQLAREKRTEISSYSRNIDPIRQGLDGQIVQARAALAANDARIAALGPQVETARFNLTAVPTREFRLGQLQVAFDTYRQAYRTLNDKYQSLLISQSAPVANANVLSKASKAVKIRPNLKTNLIFGFFFGLIAAMNAALIAEKLDDRVHSEEDVRGATGLPVLASIPKVAHFDAQSLVTQLGATSGTGTTPLLESYRMLRTSLMFTVLDSASRSIVLTSSQANEGKSSVAANLATVLALNGKTVLLIDADLRRPSAHRLFKLSSQNGFSSVAAGLCTLEEAIQNTEVEGLRVLVGGQSPPNPPEMLDSKAGRAIFQRAREMADVVIIDAPPALMMADAQIIASEADGVLLVVSWEEALKNNVSRTTDTMARTGAKLLGVVINKWDDHGVDYGRYYQHSSAALPESKTPQGDFKA